TRPAATQRRIEVDLAMAHATIPPETALADHVTPSATTGIQHPPITPGKVAMWLFLATEVMFFTALIGSYVVLPRGSPPKAYSNLYPPGTDLALLRGTEGVLIQAAEDHEKVAAVLRKEAGLTEQEAEARLHELPHALINGLTPEKAKALQKALE